MALMISNKDTVEIELQEQFITKSPKTKASRSYRLSTKHIIVLGSICLLVVVGAISIALYLSNRSSPTVNEDWHLEFVTDIEGHYEYFQNIVNHSKVIKFGKPDNGQPVLEWMSGMETKGYFVVGGDTVDRGIGDIRMVTSLVAFKLKYPKRVILIIGNRDFNKLRFQRELNGPLIDTEILIAEYESIRGGNVGPLSDEKKAEFRACYGKNATKTLKWILANTMGAPKAFENRRIELAELGRKHENEDVVSSYLQSMDPTKGEEAFMWNYINNAVFVWQFGKHLFMHGPYGYTNGSIGEWRNTLKTIRQDFQFKYENEPSNQFNFSYFRKIVETDLRTYNQDFRLFVPTTHFNGTPFGQPSLKLFYGAEGDALYGMNVYHGHIPAGQDTPTIMITPHDAFPYYLINADTSYGCFRTDEDRGGSYANTLITSTGIYVEGWTAVDDDGKCQTEYPSKPYQFAVPFTANYGEGFDKNIGTVRNIDDENKLVKFKINDTKNEYVTQLLTEEVDANGRVHLHALFGLCTY